MPPTVATAAASAFPAGQKTTLFKTVADALAIAAAATPALIAGWEIAQYSDL